MCEAAACDLGHIMTNCRHFGERPNRDDMVKLEGHRQGFYYHPDDDDEFSPTMQVLRFIQKMATLVQPLTLAGTYLLMLNAPSK